MKIPSQVKTKNVAAVVLIAILITTVGCYFTFAQSPSTTFTVSPGVYPGAPSFTVWREGSYYFAKDAKGEIKYSGNDAKTVIQSAIDNSNPGASIFIARGEYLLTQSILVTKSIRISGEMGISTERLDNQTLVTYGTKLKVQTDGITAIQIKCTQAVILEDLTIVNAVYHPTADGSGISVEGWTSSEWNQHSRFNRLRIVAFNKGINIKAAGDLVIDQCYIALCNYGVVNMNTVDPDVGDNTICNSVLSCYIGNGTNIYISSGGGLRIINNKIFYGDYGIYTAFDKLTSNLLIEGNSIEGQDVNAIYLSASVLFFNVMIVGNQFGALYPSNGAFVKIASTNIRSTLFSGNVITGSIGQIGLLVLGANGVAVHGNFFNYLDTGVSSGSTSYGVVVIGNTFKAVTTSYTGVTYAGSNYNLAG